jgi:hypothetical protein
MDSSYVAPDLAILDTADRIGRTAHLWLRQQAVTNDACHSLNSPFNTDRGTHLLVAGFISKLCDSLQLTLQHGLLAAYAYALLDDSNSNSLAVAAILLDARTVPPPDGVFEKGRSIAAQMLDQLNDSGYSEEAADGADWRISHFAC